MSEGILFTLPVHTVLGSAYYASPGGYGHTTLAAFSTVWSGFLTGDEIQSPRLRIIQRCG